MWDPTDFRDTGHALQLAKQRNGEAAERSAGEATTFYGTDWQFLIAGKTIHRCCTINWHCRIKKQKIPAQSS
jgi:hypothetical protein